MRHALVNVRRRLALGHRLASQLPIQVDEDSARENYAFLGIIMTKHHGRRATGYGGRATGENRRVTVDRRRATDCGRRATGGGRGCLRRKVVARNFLYGQPYKEYKNAQIMDFSKIP
jgi:hypothetical protein